MKRWMFTALTLVSIVSWGCARTESYQTTDTNSSAEEDHSGHDHGDHEGHDHGDHEGHDHGDHEGHDHADHEGHDHGDHEGHDHGDTVAIALYCGDCGQGVAKGAEHKCDPSGEACSKCSFHKGSALCCKITGDFAGKALCASCGQIKGTAVCCQEDAAVCKKCGLHSGSPLCCKLGTSATPAVDEAAPAPEAP